MDNGLERRMSNYEPLWNEWYIDSFAGENPTGVMYRLKDKNGRKSAVRVLTVDSRVSKRPLSELTSAAIGRINDKMRLAGEAFIVSARNFTVKNHENIGSAPVAADILVQTDEYEPLSAITAKGQLPYMTARKLADNICRGLRTAHKAGFTFGDICPENIWVDSEGHFCLDAPCTFDPKRADPTYAAPETQTEGFDPYKADIYSYGLVLYRIFNGGLLPLQQPDGDPAEAVRARMNGAAFDPPRGAPPELQRFIMQCCMAHPETRYESMDEVYRVLRQLTVDHVPTEYEECNFCDICTPTPRPKKQIVHPVSQPKEFQPNQPQTEEQPREIKESKGMKLYVMVLLYILLFAGVGFLLFSIFFLK
ncbi:protein kinase [Ruminococcus sp.]|uniref:protein kinase domain-containing protein n=1 Tax=Ruminococcus sp. TaxID=41978 RepID=UPI0025F584CF|nr:protein kinase [Ruminococcus sp.]MBQ9543244.1 protein kinase [Ruminococcus sp.]